MVFLKLFVVVLSSRLAMPQKACPSRENVIFTKYDNSTVNGEPISVLTTSTLEECPGTCMHILTCWSVNVLKLSSTSYECQFFSTNQYQADKYLQSSTTSTYFEIDYCKLCSIIQSTINTCLCDCRNLAEVKSDCKSWHESGFHGDGLYNIQVESTQISVSCEMTIDGGGWVKFQNRFDGSQEFYLSRDEYTTGFGSLTGEFWLGNENIHLLTKNGNHELRVDLKKVDGTHGYALYDNFYVKDTVHAYRMDYDRYVNGTAGNSLDYDSRDNRDVVFCTLSFSGDYVKCPTIYKSTAKCYEGAWWFNNGVISHLNGKYFSNGVPDIDFHGLQWITFTDQGKSSLTQTSMMIRRKNN